jgi:catechol 2,3-dioxygenase-like lactoylglutathione lyase family enzyme
MIVQADHIALSVKDMDRAIAFYRDVIGMQKTFDREYDETMAQLIGVQGTRVRIVHMKLADTVVELFDYHYPVGREPRPDRRQSDYGLTHIGFLVEDFWATYQHLVDHEVVFLSDPVEVRPGVYVAYFHGAEYEVCEIREIVSEPED